MNKLNPDSLFSIFEQGDQEIYKEHKIEELLENPFTLLGTVVNGLENFHLLDKLYSFKYQDRYGEVRHKIQHKYYGRMYTYLLKIDIGDMASVIHEDTHLDVGRIIELLYDLLLHYQHIEQYEKCGKIKKYTDLLLSKKLEDLL